MQSGRQQGQPDSKKPVFFLDRGLGRYLVANAIRSQGYEALPMADVYPDGRDQRLPDPEWMRRADQEGWVAISKDRDIPRAHADTLAATTLRLFLFPNPNVSGAELVRRLMDNWDTVLRRAATNGPYAYVIHPRSLVRRWP